MIDQRAAQDFTTAICRDAVPTWQVFDDRKPKGQKRDPKAAKWGAPLTQALPWLASKQADGCGIFLQINASPPGHRLQRDVTAVRALFCDFDHGRPQHEWLLRPSIGVRTRSGRWHAYWLTDDCPLADFWQAQRRLASYYGSDPSMSNLERVMRLPGSLHQKGAPSLVKLLHCTPTRYAFAELMRGVPELPPPPPRPPLPPSLRLPAGQQGDRPDFRRFDAPRFASDYGLDPQPSRHAGKLWIACPWQTSHTDGAQGPSDTVLWLEPGKWPTFRCFHAACASRSIVDFMALCPDLPAYCA